MVSAAKPLLTKDYPSVWGLLKSLVHLLLADFWSRMGWVNKSVRLGTE